MLFRITDSDIFIDNPELGAIKEFAKLESRKLKWIFFVYDYKSPYRELPLQRRKELVGKEYLSHKRPNNKSKAERTTIVAGLDKDVNAASEAFIGMQFDEDNETLKAYEVLLGNIRDEIAAKPAGTDDAKKKAELGKMLPALIKAKSDIKKALGAKEDAEAEKAQDDRDDNIDISLLDELNEEQYG